MRSPYERFYSNVCSNSSDPDCCSNKFHRSWRRSRRAPQPVHILTSCLALLLGPWQFSAAVRRRPRLHRWTGRVYAATAVAGGVTGTLAAASTANGPVAGAGFAVLGVLWVVATVRAVRCARARDFEAHRRWAIVSFALAYAAVMLRLYIPLSMAAGLSFAGAYPVIAWLCWVPNLWIAFRLGRTRTVDLAA